MMFQLLALLAATPMCRTVAEPTPFVSNAACEFAVPALEHLAHDAAAHSSARTFTWANAALADLSGRCSSLLSFNARVDISRWPPSRDWRWLADVNSRTEALDVIHQHLGEHWSWAFAWNELTTAPCSGMQCRAFRDLRDGQWSKLTDLPAIDEAIDLPIKTVALEALGRHDEALALANTIQPSKTFFEHPIHFALLTAVAHIRDGRWNEPSPSAAALEPGHALRTMLRTSGPRVPQHGEQFQPLF